MSSILIEGIGMFFCIFFCYLNRWRGIDALSHGPELLVEDVQTQRQACAYVGTFLKLARKFESEYCDSDSRNILLVHYIAMTASAVLCFSNTELFDIAPTIHVRATHAHSPHLGSAPCITSRSCIYYSHIF
jgi:hypothetical protein